MSFTLGRLQRRKGILVNTKDTPGKCGNRRVVWRGFAEFRLGLTNFIIRRIVIIMWGDLISPRLWGGFGWIINTPLQPQLRNLLNVYWSWRGRRRPEIVAQRWLSLTLRLQQASDRGLSIQSLFFTLKIEEEVWYIRKLPFFPTWSICVLISYMANQTMKTKSRWKSENQKSQRSMSQRFSSLPVHSESWSQWSWTEKIELRRRQIIKKKNRRQTEAKSKKDVAEQEETKTVKRQKEREASKLPWETSDQKSWRRIQLIGIQGNKYMSDICANF